MFKAEEIKLLLSHVYKAPSTVGAAITQSSLPVQKMLALQAALEAGKFVEIVTAEEGQMLVDFRKSKALAGKPAATPVPRGRKAAQAVARALAETTPES